jgi:glycerol uptake facilitator-like aquaporin
MAKFDLTRRLVAEGLGTGLLVAAVIGSGIMAAKLAGGNAAIALLCNTLATGAILIVIITIFAPLSGAHFNPAVSVVALLRGDLDLQDTLGYVAVQIAGGCLGAIFAHLMFGLDPLQLSATARDGWPQWLAEFVATFGLLLTILGCVRFRPEAVGFAVGLYITSAYWFTSSTSFANPSRDHRPLAQRHIRRHRACQCAGLCRGRVCRCAGCGLAGAVAVRGDGAGS